MAFHLVERVMLDCSRVTDSRLVVRCVVAWAAVASLTMLVGCGGDASGADGGPPVDGESWDGRVDTVCAEGAVETRPSPECGLESRTCDDGGWGEWVLTESGPADPECYPGDAQPIDPDDPDPAHAFCDSSDEVGMVRRYYCTDSCRWSLERSECGGGCPGVRRTDPFDAMEVCLPRRTFTRGCDDPAQDCYPRHEIEVSAFWIDRFTVTVRRYQECVDAGACTRLTPDPVDGYPTTTLNYTFDDLAFDDPSIPVWTATHQQAQAFCQWDGAELITGAQWERAALGFLDAARLPGTYDDRLSRDWRELDVELLTYAQLAVDVCSSSSCEVSFNLPPRFAVAFDGVVATRRHKYTNGVENLFCFFEWTSDTTAPYVPDTPPERDPRSVTGSTFERRGGPLTDRVGRWDMAARDATQIDPNNNLFPFPGSRGAIRCARPAIAGDARVRGEEP